MRIRTLLLLILPALLMADERLFEKVASLNIGTEGYVLGKLLTTQQKKTAQRYPEEAKVSGTYKFRDKTLHLVADKKSDRIILIYEMFKAVDTVTMQSLVSRYIHAFEEPTLVTHDNIIYWIYHKDGHKLSGDALKRSHRQEHAKISGKTLSEVVNTRLPESTTEGSDGLVTVKLQSSRPFSETKAYRDAQVYLMISSERLLRRLLDADHSFSPLR